MVMNDFDCEAGPSHFASKNERMPASSPMSNGPAFSSNYFALDTSGMLVESSRRQSFASTDASIGLDVFSSPSIGTASPPTPMTTSLLSIVSSGAYLNNTAQDLNVRNICSFSNDDFLIDDFPNDDALWMRPSSDSGNQNCLYNHFAGPEPAEMDHPLSGVYSHSYYQVLSQNTLNPALSLPIFSEPLLLPSVAVTPNQNGFATWPQTPTRTVAPHATFHPVLASSSAPNDEPVTPLRSAGCSSGGLNGSPLLSYTPGFLPSQHEVDESPFSMIGSPAALTPGDIARLRRATSRLTRRQYARKGPHASSRISRSAANKSGFNCEEIIPQNEFACKYKDCIDKDTGKQKRFKRQEHKKRHEKTVHEKERHNQYKCWVPECKTAPFSRTDNLKSHLQKTHGKKSANARNRYVATQDKNSEFYDPEWVGNLSIEGYPILDSGPKDYVICGRF